MHVDSHIWLWPFFIFGMAFYILIRATSAVRSKRNNLKSHWQYVTLNWDILLIRCIIEAVFFWLWVFYPDALKRILDMIPTSLVPSAVQDWNLTLPLVPPVAFVLGTIADVLMDLAGSYIPRLKVYVPSIPDTPPEPPAADAAHGG